MKNLLLILTLLFPFQGLIAQNILTATYNSGDIPTIYNAYNDSCNGPSATLSVTLPPGDNYTVTSVDVEYEMTALGSGRTSHQRSLIKFQNFNVEESSETFGKNNEPGTYEYARTINIAEGKYSGGTELIFEMKARRTVEGSPGCNTSVNRVDATTWTIIVYYNDELSNPKVGINKITPSQALDVKGKLKLSDDNTAPEAGTIRWNNDIKDFEGYNGIEWLSFTKNEGGNWGNKDITENGSIAVNSGLANDYFGHSVCISGDFAIVGATFATVGTNENQGKAYIFKKEEGNWLSEGTLVSSDGTASDLFGSSVSISGDYAIIGAPLKDIGSNFSQGKAYIFKRTAFSWIEEASLVPSDATANDNFGSSVSISGDYAIIGAPFKNIGTNVNQGRAYIFKRSGTSWVEQAPLIAADSNEFDQFGSSVSISGDYAIIGVQYKDIGSNFDQGKAYIFKRSGFDWLLQAGLTASNSETSNNFGSSVSISEDYAVIAGYDESIGLFGLGRVYFFKRSGSTWSEQASVIASDGSGGDSFGASVSISGDYTIIGASQKNINDDYNQGKAYIYKRNGTIWLEQAGIIASDGSEFDFFGNSVSISGDNIIVGAFGVEVDGNDNQGKVYFYNKEGGN